MLRCAWEAMIFHKELQLQFTGWVDKVAGAEPDVS